VVLYEQNDKATRLRWWLLDNAVSLTAWCHNQWLRSHAAGRLYEQGRRQ